MTNWPQYVFRRTIGAGTSGGFTPPDVLPANMQVWFLADSGVYNIANGDISDGQFVVHMTNFGVTLCSILGAADGVKWNSNVLNSHPGMLFYGSSPSSLSVEGDFPGDFIPTGTQDNPFTVFTVCTPSSSTIDKVLIGCADILTNDSLFEIFRISTDGTYSSMMKDENAVSITLSTNSGYIQNNSSYVLTNVCSGTSMSLYKNGSLAVTGSMNLGNFNLNICQWGAMPASVDTGDKYFFSGRMYEFLAWNTNFSDVNRIKIESYLGSKYGIAVS